jgi:hypothetical protein
MLYLIRLFVLFLVLFEFKLAFASRLMKIRVNAYAWKMVPGRAGSNALQSVLDYMDRWAPLPPPPPPPVCPNKADIRARIEGDGEHLLRTVDGLSALVNELQEYPWVEARTEAERANNRVRNRIQAKIRKLVSDPDVRAYLYKAGARG